MSALFTVLTFMLICAVCGVVVWAEDRLTHRGEKDRAVREGNDGL